jgi:MetJ family methionine regulon transcriptional repressor
LHAFTGQPLPDDQDLEKDNDNLIPKEARKLMQEMGLKIEDSEES